jgi:two-component system phosphate regulon sensor histidine kinase PhoR
MGVCLPWFLVCYDVYQTRAEASVWISALPPARRQNGQNKPIGDIVLPHHLPEAKAFASQTAQRLYVRRRLLLLTAAVIFIFVAAYGLPLPAALLGLLSIVAGAAIISPEGVYPASAMAGARRLIRQDSVIDVLEGLPSPVILLDSYRRVASFNSLATDLWPHLRQGDHISSYIRDPGVLHAVEEAHVSMRPRQMVPYELRVPIERHMEARISWIGVAETDPHAPAILLHLRDLTDRERIERLRSDFVTNASHELRTPLASLIGFIETLQGAARNDDAARGHFLEIMARQARRMARLIDNLLSLSRIEMRIHLRPDTIVDLNDIAAQVLTDLEPLADQSAIEFHFTGLPDLAWVLGDRDELIQVLANLVENGIKYGRQGGNVWLTIESRSGTDAGKLSLTVRDDGLGIDAAHLPRLTERFYRANDNSGEKSGTGLGLAIVRNVVARHRGDLRITSELGKGSAFTIVLGAAPAPIQQDAPS